MASKQKAEPKTTQKRTESKPSEKKSFGGIRTDEGGRPVTDDGGRPVLESDENE